MQRLLVCTTCCVGLFAGAVSAASSGRVEAAQAGTVAAPETKVVCGMTLITADPGTDPGIAAPRRRSPTRYTIRAIQPPICR
jgi:hypothetical protein